jgi:hypothetical protein
VRGIVRDGMTQRQRNSVLVAMASVMCLLSVVYWLMGGAFIWVLLAIALIGLACAAAQIDNNEHK